MVQPLAAGKLGTVAQASNCSTLESRQEDQKSKVSTSQSQHQLPSVHEGSCRVSGSQAKNLKKKDTVWGRLDANATPNSNVGLSILSTSCI